MILYFSLFGQNVSYMEPTTDFALYNDLPSTTVKWDVDESGNRIVTSVTQTNGGDTQTKPSDTPTKASDTSTKASGTSTKARGSSAKSSDTETKGSGSKGIKK